MFFFIMTVVNKNWYFYWGQLLNKRKISQKVIEFHFLTIIICLTDEKIGQ